ncbi:DUF3718 domain-containing protein [Shewanella yunxiaonensis]|uniref:DUF3718 domain-containing protein n=1 Tax=Shewanella yunxiaonensis TaxID=2829809 RepID=A0ABX7YP15_9GAMM|nr:MULTISPECIES: DUF3718 domain-containing protein [Shewanella]QUN04442.1 DUF3718 domain-containing protein [Shewanella yunxiaonensis]
MNSFKIAGLILAVTFTSAISAKTYQFIGTDNTPETQFCVSVGNNDLGEMKSKLMRLGLSDFRRNINSLTCNDLSAAKFADKYQAYNTFRYLNMRSSGKNRVKPTVTIRDISRAENTNDTSIEVVYVSAHLK